MQDEYPKARKKGEKAYRKAVAEGGYPFPPVLDIICEEAQTLSQIPVGQREIPLDMVVGTKTAGRTNAFTTDFLPILEDGTEFAAKWNALYASQCKEGIRDPIKCYEYMHKFYVQEGNKRVSILKYVGAQSIQADVTRIMPRKTEDLDVRAYYEFLDFYNVAPLYEIEFSNLGSYHDFAANLGLTLDKPWSRETLEDIKASFSLFSRLFKARGGDRIDLTTADAMLVYLHFYYMSTLLTDREEVIGSRIDRLWKEMLTIGNDDNITFLEKPLPAEEKPAGLFDFISRTPLYTAADPLKIAFMYDKSPEVSGWIYSHELGRNHVDEAFGGVVKTMRVDNCDNDDKLEDEVDKVIEAGAQVIVTTSPVMMGETLRCAIHFPKQFFLNCSVNMPFNSVRTYYARIYEAKFVLGAIAACEATDHKIGYLASYPIFGQTAAINAFAIGAAMIDPRAEIHLKWSKVKGCDWKKEFAEEGVSVISGPDQIVPGTNTREYGVYMLRRGMVLNLAAPIWDWGKFYEQITRHFLSEANSKAKEKAQAITDQGMNYWWGMDSGVISVLYSEHISYNTRKMAEFLTKAISNGWMNPFEGEIHSQAGVLKGWDEPDLKVEQVINMNWLNDNIVGSIPAFEDLEDDARQTCYVSGVTEIFKETFKK